MGLRIQDLQPKLLGLILDSLLRGTLLCPREGGWFSLRSTVFYKGGS